MGKQINVTVPDIGDFKEVEVIEVLVQPGQDVSAEDGLITLETDKAAMDVPSPHDGKLISMAVKEGDTVSEGDVIAILDIVSAEKPQAEPTQIVSTVSASDAATVAMPRLAEIRVPNLGDFEKVEVIDVMVKAGDPVEVETSLVTLETDKAAMDVPSPLSGVVRDVVVKTGDLVSEGDVLAFCETSESETADVAPSETPAVPTETLATVPDQPQMPPSAGAVPAVLPEINEGTFRQAHASPAVRKFARELGVDLGRVSGSGVKARVTKDDVKAFVKAIMSGGAVAAAGSALPDVPVVDFSKYGDIELQPLTRIQKISGPRLHASWVNIPHVTHNDLGDFTDTEKTRKGMKADARAEGISLTPLAFVVRACVIALQEMPLFNSSLSEDGKSLVMKNFINLGFAADTPNGLMVPVIHNAQDLSVLELARQLSELSALARDGKLKATQMQGGTFTVSSLGGIGGTSFTPVINAPEVAILGVSRARVEAVFADDEFQPRLMLPLSLSYDHRVIDGANAARFTARLAQLVADSEELLS